MLPLVGVAQGSTLATLTRNTIVFTGGARITKLSNPTPLQRRAFEFIAAPIPIQLNPM